MDPRTGDLDFLAVWKNDGGHVGHTCNRHPLIFYINWPGKTIKILRNYKIPADAADPGGAQEQAERRQAVKVVGHALGLPGFRMVGLPEGEARPQRRNAGFHQARHQVHGQGAVAVTDQAFTDQMVPDG